MKPVDDRPELSEKRDPLELMESFATILAPENATMFLRETLRGRTY